ncbi:hypothetical protein AQUCO_08400017v1 [Aquilegia coerulea]|nr:hypothetical protein AQUCO_08400017v1 [Aquilegia coerulea]
MGRSTYLPAYNQSEDLPHQELISTVEKTMKKYADNLLRFLEGISSRLSQLELYCYNLEKSVGEMRSDLLRENREADSKLSSLEKHLQEVHRAIQILRDKQELADAQKELAKLHLVHKESSTGGQSPQKEEVVTPSASDLKKLDSPPEVQKQQLALALPHQLNPPTSQPPRNMEQHLPMGPSPQVSSQNVHLQAQPSYYPQQNQLPAPALQAQHPQDRYSQVDPQYQRPQMQTSQPAPQQLQSHVSQVQPVHAISPYQQQWPQQYPQQVQQQQQLQQSSPAQVVPQTPSAYPPYPPTQSVNPSPETFSSSMPMQVTLSGITQQGVGRPETVNYGYGGSNRPAVQQQPSQHNLQRPQQPPTLHNSFGPPLTDSTYPVGGSHSPQAPRQGYMVYDGEGGRASYPMQSHFQQAAYPPHVSSLQSSVPVRHLSPSPMMRSNPYNELVEKAVGMGYGRDFVVNVIQNMEESGQPMDFNSLLDRLNMHSSGGSQRAWSG